MISVRRSLRAQLTLLYAVPFFTIGAALSAVPFLGVRESVPVGSGEHPPHEVQFPFATWAVSLAGVLLVALILGWLVAGRMLRPLRAITAAARDISATNLERRLGPTGRTAEFADLAGTLDGLFARLEAAFASQRRFVANAAHELRTPLTAQRTLLQVALADPDVSVGSLGEAAREVLALGAAQQRLIDALLTLASGEQGVERREPLDLSEVCRCVLSERPAGGLRVTAELSAAPTTGDVSLVESLVKNLVDNAMRHNLPGGWVQVSTGMSAGGARITVRNSGPVVPATEVDRLLEPFQQLQGNRTGDGHGLGLTIVRAIAAAHGAELTVDAPGTGGLQVAVTFRG